MTETISYSPTTGEEIGRTKNSDLSKLPEIINKAKSAQKIWSKKSFKERARHVAKIKSYLAKNAEKIARVISKSNGKTLTDSLATEVLPCAMACDWYSNNAERILGNKSVPMGHILFANKSTSIKYEPVGVVGIISPWNYPFSIPFGEIIMGLMAGNAIVLKVATICVLVGEAIKECMDAGELPDGLFVHLKGSGSKISNAMFSGGINKIFFTGSVPVGKSLLKKSSETLTPLSLELGGNDPMIVCEDANLERAANGACWAGYQNCGQSCGGVERIYVHENVYDKFVALMKKKTKALRHGVPDLSGKTHKVDIGSMTTSSQKKLVEQHVQDAIDKGAKIIAQSKKVGNTDKGFFHPATLLVNVNHDMLLMKDETFGPLIPIMKFKNISEAIKLANDSYLALTASVWTSSNKVGKKIADQLQAGVVTINDHLYTHGLSESPWGGPKESGLGRTHGSWGLKEMCNLKAVNWETLPFTKRNIWWYPFNASTYNGLLNAISFVAPSNFLSPLWALLKIAPWAIGKMFSSWNVKEEDKKEK